jgi:hypothetical protein
MTGTDRENAYRLYAALRQLVDDLADAEQDRDPETGEEYDSCRHAQDVLWSVRGVYGSSARQEPAAAASETKSLVDAARDVLAWADMTGGWDAPCWNRLRRAVNDAMAARP